MTCPQSYDLATLRDCMRFLVDRRHTCRVLAQAEDEVYEANRRDAREARKLRELKSPMATRRAEVLEAKVASRCEALRPIGSKLMEIGRELIAFADAIDNAIPRGLLLNLLNANPADRESVKEARGFADLIFVHCVENSVERRGEAWNGSPLFRACHRRFMHELIHNEELNRTARNVLFGADGSPSPCTPDGAGGAT